MRPTLVYNFQYDLKIEGDVLDLRISNVADSPEARGRECNMELALLRAYGWHTTEPVQRAADGTLIFRHWRGGSTHETYFLARRVLEGFAVEWIDGRHGRDRMTAKNLDAVHRLQAQAVGIDAGKALVAQEQAEAAEWAAAVGEVDVPPRKATHVFVGRGAKCEYDWPSGDEPSDVCGRTREEH